MTKILLIAAVALTAVGCSTANYKITSQSGGTTYHASGTSYDPVAMVDTMSIAAARQRLTDAQANCLDGGRCGFGGYAYGGAYPTLPPQAYDAADARALGGGSGNGAAVDAEARRQAAKAQEMAADAMRLEGALHPELRQNQ